MLIHLSQVNGIFILRKIFWRDTQGTLFLIGILDYSEILNVWIDISKNIAKKKKNLLVFGIILSRSRSVPAYYFKAFYQSI